MRSLSPGQLVEVWERGQERHSVDRALLLLAYACPETSWDHLCALPVGCRDGLLLDLRAQLFGPQLASTTECPRCGEALEFTIDVEAIRLPSAEMVTGASHRLEHQGWSLEFRLPNSLDLAWVAGQTDPDPTELAIRCVIDLRDPGGVRKQRDDLPVELIRLVADEMAALDAQAEIVLNLSCPVCGHRWTSLLDIAEFLWREVSREAQQLLSEVHILARAYGWSESGILSLSGPRRRFYLGQVGG